MLFNIKLQDAFTIFYLCQTWPCRRRCFIRVCLSVCWHDNSWSLEKCWDYGQEKGSMVKCL